MQKIDALQCEKNDALAAKQQAVQRADQMSLEMESVRHHLAIVTASKDDELQKLNAKLTALQEAKSAADQQVGYALADICVVQAGLACGGMFVCLDWIQAYTAVQRLACSVMGSGLTALVCT